MRTSTSCMLGGASIRTRSSRCISTRSRYWSVTGCCRWRWPPKGCRDMGGAYDVLARIRANRGTPEPAGERCEMCSESIAEEHQHVVNVDGRQLMCVCRGCYLLFTDTNAELRYRAIPD